MDSGIIIVLLILGVTVIMLVLDLVRIDIFAIGCMLTLGWTGILDPQEMPSLWASAFGDSSVLRVIVALVGGIILGFGSRFADGCTSGHGISGTLQLAVSSWISAICFFIGGIITAHIIYRVIA